MTAPRSCRACGEPLHGDVRWCLRCFAPARELTPRAAVWAPGEFVDKPIHTGGPIPHWSRWEKSATTMGPLGRIAATIVFLATALGAASAGAFLYVLLFPATAFLVLPAIWAKGWIVPGGVETTARPAKPDTIDTHPQPPMTKAMLAWRAVWIASALAACLIFAYSPSVGAKAAVLAGSALIALVLFWRRFLDR